MGTRERAALPVAPFCCCAVRDWSCGHNLLNLSRSDNPEAFLFVSGDRRAIFWRAMRRMSQFGLDETSQGWSTANVEEGQQRHSLVHCIDGEEAIGQAVDSKAQVNQRSSVFIAAVTADGHPRIRLAMKN